MGHVRRMPNGRYEARYRIADGRERSQRFSTKRDAQRFLERVGADQQRGDWCDPSGARVRLDDWIEQRRTTTVNLRATSRARDESYIGRMYFRPSRPPPSAASLNWVSGRGSHISWPPISAPATVQKAYQTLSKILRAAVDANLIPHSPCRSIQLPKVSAGRCGS